MGVGGLGSFVKSLFTDPLGTAAKFATDGLDGVTGGGKQKEAQPGSAISFEDKQSQPKVEMSF